MDEIAAAVHDAFLAAYRPAVTARLAAAGITPPEGFDESLEEGRAWLHNELRGLLSLPFAEQHRSPLEVFQEAMRFPNEALAAAGVDPPERDATAAAALPGDRYDLAPASSQELGEEAWTAHLAWGAAKARAMSRPTVGLLSADLMDRSRVESAAGAAGYAVAAWGDAAAVAAAGRDRLPSVAFVDLVHPESDEVIRMLVEHRVRTVVFGPHVDDFALLRAKALGAADALPRSRFFRSIPNLLPAVV
jgi:hypothetical protein